MPNRRVVRRAAQRRQYLNNALRIKNAPLKLGIPTHNAFVAVLEVYV